MTNKSDIIRRAGMNYLSPEEQAVVDKQIAMAAEEPASEYGKQKKLKCTGIAAAPKRRMRKFALWLLLFCAFPMVSFAGKQLVYGRLIEAREGGILVLCEGAKHSHPTGSYGIADSPEMIAVHVEGDGDTLNALSKNQLAFLKAPPSDTFTTILFVAEPHGTFTYATKTGLRSTVPNFVNAEALPSNSTVTPIESR